MDTLRSFAARYPEDELWLLMGTDALAGLGGWKSPKRIVRLARIAAFYREPYTGKGLSNPPVSGLPDRLEVFDAGSVTIRRRICGRAQVRIECRAVGTGSGCGVHYEAGSLRFRGGAALKRQLSARDKVREGLTAALDKKAAAILVFNLTELTTMADYFVLSTASSDRQARAIADASRRPWQTSLRRRVFDGQLVLMDYGDVVFHVFQEDARRFYALERLWGDAENETGRFAASL